MRDGYRHQDCRDHDADAECEAPDFELPVQGPDRREYGFGPRAEEGPFQEIARCVVWKGVREERFDVQEDVYQAFEASRVQVVCDNLEKI